VIIPGRTTEKVQKQVVAVLVQGDGWIRVRPGSFRIAEFAWGPRQPIESGFSCEPTGGRPGNRVQGPLRSLVAVEVESSEPIEPLYRRGAWGLGREPEPTPGPRLATGNEPDDEPGLLEEASAEDPEPAL